MLTNAMWENTHKDRKLNPLFDDYPQDDDIIEGLTLYCPGGGGYFYDETYIKRKFTFLIKKYP